MNLVSILILIAIINPLSMLHPPTFRPDLCSNFGPQAWSGIGDGFGMAVSIPLVEKASAGRRIFAAGNKQPTIANHLQKFGKVWIDIVQRAVLVLQIPRYSLENGPASRIAAKVPKSQLPATLRKLKESSWLVFCEPSILSHES